jgi:hypothetical protein
MGLWNTWKLVRRLTISSAISRLYRERRRDGRLTKHFILLKLSQVKILLDECVHGKMKQALPGHEVRTVADENWEGIKNGKLLALAAKSFDAFLTVDKNLQFQQNLEAIPLPVIVIHSRFIRWKDIEPYCDAIRSLLSTPIERKFHIIE